ncbi:MAG: hypothetical protein LWW86_07765 [Micrococcales bacterium]|nr:hypothetical protein [Micrococcales bacterium]
MSESEAVRAYRFLLQSVATDDLVAAHEKALAEGPASDREEVLSAVLDVFGSGTRTSADNARVVARLAVLGERRQPGALLAALSPEVLERLATGVREAGLGIDEEAYAAWEPRAPRLGEAVVTGEKGSPAAYDAAKTAAQNARWGHGNAWS